MPEMPKKTQAEVDMHRIYFNKDGNFKSTDMAEKFLQAVDMIVDHVQLSQKGEGSARMSDQDAIAITIGASDELKDMKDGLGQQQGTRKSLFKGVGLGAVERSLGSAFQL